MKALNPYAHRLNSDGTACEDGTSRAGAIPCAACQWASEQESAENNWETTCPAREDGIHCDHWYDGEACCDCNDPADPEVGGPREATGAIWPNEEATDEG